MLYRRRPAVGRGRRPDPAQARGPQPHRRAQGPQRARPGAAHQADGQAAGDRRDRRRPARRRHGHRVRAARPRVRRLHGRGGHPPAGAQRGPDAAARRHGGPGDHRLAHAQGRDQRGAARLGRPTSTPPTTCSAPSAGPHPFPAMVRDFVRGIGVEARQQCLDAERRAARRGRRLRGRRLERDRHVPRVHPRRGGRACTASRPAATASTPAGTPPASPAAPSACCTAPGRSCSRTRTGRPSSRTRSRPGWTTRPSGRSTPGCTRPAGRRYEPVTDAEAMDGVRAAVPHRGHHPGDRERARAGRRAAGDPGAGRRAGPRADRPGLPVRPRRQGRRDRRLAGSGC